MLYSKNKIDKALRETGLNFPKVIIYNKIDSTNEAAKRLKDFENGQVILARFQSSGKGRLSKTFVSPRGSGIYMSVILTEKISAPLLITEAVAVAVSRCIEKVFNKHADIKWVNDLFYNESKICGILCESVLGYENKLEAVIVGIGINIYENAVFKNLSRKVGALFTKEENDKVDASQLIAEIATQITSFDYESDFLTEYKSKCITLNREVEVLQKEPYSAFAIDIDKNGALIVRKSDGVLNVINSGEVSVKIN